MTIGLVIKQTPLRIITTSLSNGTENISYSAKIVVRGGYPPKTFSISSGSLPAGLTLNSSSGILSGTPIVSGTFNFTVSVIDSENSPSTVSHSYSLLLNSGSLTILTSSINDATQYVTFSQTLVANSGYAPYIWSVYSGMLPTGMSLDSSTGILSGNPTVSGTSNFIIRVTDSHSVTYNKSFSCVVQVSSLPQTSSITQYGITWTFSNPVGYGQYTNGDYWIIGPAIVTGITNNYHTESWQPVQGDDASQVNPAPGSSIFGYAHSGYVLANDFSRPNGAIISPTNTKTLHVNESLVSSVNWLGTDMSHHETGAPSGSVTYPLYPSYRCMAVLTCVPSAPVANSFRPPICGTDKTSYYTISDIDISSLKNLSASSLTYNPTSGDIETFFSNIVMLQADLANSWEYEHWAPTMNGNSYGRYMANNYYGAMLMTHMDYTTLNTTRTKSETVMRLVQIGLDLTGIADNGGDWGANGGHRLGRKGLILYTGKLLNNTHMLNVGSWLTNFEEDDQTFYVSQADVDMCNSGSWAPDSRDGTPVKFTNSNIGAPAWGITYTAYPAIIDNVPNPTYCDINMAPGFIMSILCGLMNLKTTWNHPAFFACVTKYYGLLGGSSSEYAYTAELFAKAFYNLYSGQLSSDPVRHLYTVSYNGNTSTSGTTPSSSTVDSDTSYTVLGNIGTLAKTGDYFNGWNTASDGSGITYQVGAKFKVMSDVTLYAIWTVSVWPAFAHSVYEDFNDTNLQSGITKTDTGGFLTVNDVASYKSSPSAMSINFASKNASSILTYTFGSVNSLSFGFWYKTSPDKVSNRDIVIGAIGYTLTMYDYHGDKFSFVFASGATDATFTTTPSTWYWISGYIVSNASSTINVYDESHALVHTFTTTARNNSIGKITIGDDGTTIRSTGKSYWDDFIVDLTAAQNPILGWL